MAETPMLMEKLKQVFKVMEPKANRNDLLELKAEWMRQVMVHFSTANAKRSNSGVTRQLLWREYLAEHPDGSNVQLPSLTPLHPHPIKLRRD